MAPIDQFSDDQFVSDECGDSLWNEENLNPPTTSTTATAPDTASSTPEISPPTAQAKGSRRRPATSPTGE